MKVPTFTVYNHKIMWLLPKFLELIYHFPFSLPKKLNWTSSVRTTPVFCQPVGLPLRHPKFLPIEWSFQKWIWSSHLTHAHPQGFKHFSSLTLKMKVAQSCLSLRPYGLCSPWHSAGQNTGVGSLSLLQGIFPTQGSNPGLLHCRQILYQLSHKGSPFTLS